MGSYIQIYYPFQVNFCEWYKIGVQFHIPINSCPAFPISFFKSIVSPFLGPHFCSIGLCIYLILVPYCFDFYSFVELSVQFSSVTQSCPTLWDPMDCNTPGFPVHHQHPELNQTHVHRIGDGIQPFHPLSSPSPSAFNLSQYQDLFKWVSSSHHVDKVLEVQL